MNNLVRGQVYEQVKPGHKQINIKKKRERAKGSHGDKHSRVSKRKAVRKGGKQGGEG